jgi:hypothetical protein
MLFLPIALFMAPSDVVAKPMMIVELREQLLEWERKLEERENALVARENDMVAAKHALGRAHMQCDVDHDRVKAVLLDYQARLRASTISQWRSLEFDRVLSGRQFTLSAWETDLEQWEEKLAEDQAWGLYSFDERNLSAELESLRERVAGVEDERAI